ncbi:MAG: TIGR03668 family PPOX class F420-dependent oxidoreductase [Chromatiales bacterium]|nr:TIGR03668 family PPOX class F420-dependent oxidoreductase [Chromatiales bacterium]
MPINQPHRAFIEAMRVARLATVSAAGAPFVVPVCFTLIDDSIYITIDEKPKAPNARPLKRVRNILENPQVSLVLDHYDEDWTQLGWVMVHGRGDILAGGDEHALAQAALRKRYAQYRTMELSALPVIAVRVARTVGWGHLECV